VAVSERTFVKVEKIGKIVAVASGPGGAATATYLGFFSHIPQTILIILFLAGLVPYLLYLRLIRGWLQSRVEWHTPSVRSKYE
jgi:hypothetical protein